MDQYDLDFERCFRFQKLRKHDENFLQKSFTVKK